VWLTVF